MKIYFNRDPSDKTSVNIVAKNLATYFSLYGIEYTLNVKDNWDLELAFMYEQNISLFKKPVVQRLDGIYIDIGIPYQSMNFPIIETYKRAKGVIFQSKFSYNLIGQNFGYPKQKNIIIYNGTPLIDYNMARNSIFESYPNYKSIIENNKILVCAAKWRFNKRLSSIIHGFIEYYKHNPDTYLFVIGETDPLENNIKHSNIIYMDRITNDNTRNFLVSADVCLNLSFLDSCPNTVIEAFANGTPCIITNNQGVVELMNDGDGVIIKFDEWDYKPIKLKNAAKMIDPEIVSDAIGKCIKLGRHESKLELEMSVIAKKYADFLKGLF